MAARRQPSTTSLSKFARAGASELDTQNRATSMNFCNAFWGLGDAGVDVLFARMRGASRTMDELRNYWKERWSIEEEYAKRMAKLAKVPLGKDEIGELRNSLDTIRLETDKQAGFHLQLAQQIRNDLENQSTVFHNRQLHHKKTYQTGIERQFKAKQTQESYVTKAREKYESDCMRINSYTAQATLVQGKELEKLQLRLQRTQQTVQANERDFANFTRALSDTTQKWELDWKAFCDSCQDLEEERIDFMKDTMWAYANAVSTVCVSDDESCEKIRLALEQIETEKDMENFVRDYGTGPLIPDPPPFVNYTDPDATPSASARPTTRSAHFARSSQRTRTPLEPEPEEEPTGNAAGVGAGGRMGAPNGDASQSALSRSNTHRSVAPASPSAINGTNGAQMSNGASASAAQALARKPSSYRTPVPDPTAEPIDPRAETELKIGGNSYKVDPSRDPQGGSRNGLSPLETGTFGPPSTRPNGMDPLEKQMEALKNAVSGTSSGQRSGVFTPDPRSNGPSSLIPPTGSASPKRRDYRNSAEIVVGAHPSVAGHASRPVSPNPPMGGGLGASSPVSPESAEHIQNVLANYEQSFPGERKSIGSNSRRGSYSAPPPAQSPGNAGYNPNRPPSRVGHPGIGTYGGSRTASPQPISRSASPAAPNHQQYPSGQPGHAPTRSTSSYISPPPANSIGRSGSIARSASPNSVGIALDPNGRVAHDEMAQRYNNNNSNAHSQSFGQQAPPPPQGYGNSPARRASYVGPNNAVVPSPQQQGYGAPPPINPPAPAGYQPSPQPPYSQPWQQPPHPQAMVPYSSAPPPSQYPPQNAYQSQPQAMVPQNGYPGGANGIDRGQTMSAAGYGQPPPQQGHYGQPQVGYHQPQQSQGYAMRRSPSPQPPGPAPTGQVTDAGHPILFYVKALYDYQATIEEEFDFQAGDIIAVTATPEDGWWSGELLDEARRQKNRHVFPSNFVCLLE